MVQAETGIPIDQAVEAEQTAGGITDDDVAQIIAFYRDARPLFCVKEFMVPPETGPATIDLDAFFCHRFAFCIVQDQAGIRLFMPGCGRWVDQVTQRVLWIIAEAQEQPRGKARWLANIGLRLVFLDDGRVVDMRAENGFCAMAR